MKKRIPTFESFMLRKLNENDTSDNMSDNIDIKFDIDWNDAIKEVNQPIILAMGDSSEDLFKLGDRKEIEKNTGLSLDDAKKYNETPSDAYVYGMCNAINGGKNIFFWTNGTRLKGAAEKVGAWPAVTEQLSHESVHLTRLILAKDILEAEGESSWVTAEWPSIGENDSSIIDEEAFATSVGLVVEQISDQFVKMASNFIEELKTITENDMSDNMSKMIESIKNGLFKRS